MTPTMESIAAWICLSSCDECQVERSVMVQIRKELRETMAAMLADRTYRFSWTARYSELLETYARVVDILSGFTTHKMAIYGVPITVRVGIEPVVRLIHRNGCEMLMGASA